VLRGKPVSVLQGWPVSLPALSVAPRQCVHHTACRRATCVFISLPTSHLPHTRSGKLRCHRQVMPLLGLL
jgi:hypothetical protein